MSARENKDLIRRYFEAIDRPNASPDILDQFLDPELLGDLGHVWRSIQEKLPNRLVGGRTLVWRMRCNQSELLHVEIPSDLHACR